MLQCRGHDQGGNASQYDLFKQWKLAKRPVLEAMLENRCILFGEWLYAKHSVHYRNLPHYFEFDIYDKQAGSFLDLKTRLTMLECTGIRPVPVIHQGALKADQLPDLIHASTFDSLFENPTTGKPDNLMEGLYLRTEAIGTVTGAQNSCASTLWRR